MMKLVLSYNDQSLYHMLRHFECINDSARACLLNRGYPNDKINDALEIPGSKFHPLFADDLKSLEQQLSIGIVKESFTRNGYLHHCMEFSAREFPEGIGTIGVASICELKAMGATEFEWKQNRGLELCHVKLKPLPNTLKLTLIVKQQKNYQLLITAFPGIVGLPLPKKKMTELFYEQCKQFWQEHAFIELG
jgi:hypothetical protein